ncbi:MAG: SIR2 family protein, partial [Candidatus Aenigmarchaeota archaeon]|nr:SIR2 family protein [Candidatus Aenigmarchaeota archaeon]
LGAGASADAGAPVWKNFFNKVEELIKESKFMPEETKIFNDVLYKRNKLLPESDIEEFFSYVDFQNQFDVLISTPLFVREIQKKMFNENIHNSVPLIPDLQQAGLRKKDFEKLEKDISFLISRTLHETIKDTNQEIVEIYQKLMKTFDVIISFNWDLLCEHAYRKLENKSFSDQQLGFDKNILNKPALLKLHGSLNWGLCSKCGLYLSDSEIVHQIYGAGITCPVCNKEKLSPVSILPALSKFENIIETKFPSYRLMWHSAMRAITEAKEIYFFGYSLSDNDFHTKIFFKSGIQNNINSNLKIFVIDKNCDEELQQRYNDAFLNKIKPEFIKSSFKDCSKHF